MAAVRAVAPQCADDVARDARLRSQASKLDRRAGACPLHVVGGSLQSLGCGRHWWPCLVEERSCLCRHRYELSKLDAKDGMAITEAKVPPPPKKKKNSPCFLIHEYIGLMPSVPSHFLATVICGNLAVAASTLFLGTQGVSSVADASLLSSRGRAVQGGSSKALACCYGRGGGTWD
jgi:hypothetical protein